MNKQEKMQELENQLEFIKKEIEQLKMPETYYVVVHSTEQYNWYKVGEVYKVYSEITPSSSGGYHKLVSGGDVGVSLKHVTKIANTKDIAELDRTNIQFKE